MTRVHLQPIPLAVVVVLCVAVWLVPWARMLRPRQWRLAAMGAFWALGYGAVMGIYLFAVTDSAARAAVLGLAGGLFFGVFMALYVACFFAWQRRYRPRDWNLTRAWGEIILPRLAVRWGIGNLRQQRRTFRLLRTVREEWKSEPATTTAEHFLSARSGAILDELNG